MTRSAWVGLAIGVAVLAGIYWFMYGPEDPVDILQAPPPPTLETRDVPDPSQSEPVIEHPLPEAPPEEEAEEEVEDLPELEASDEVTGKTLRELFGAAPAESLLVPKDIVRRFVLTVDSLDRDPLPLWLRPVRRVPGLYKVDREQLPREEEGDAESARLPPPEKITTSDENLRRYAPLMAMVEAADIDKLAAAYRRYYPLMQDSYDQLGNPRSRYFNDRFIQIIDHLLATPEIEGPLELVRPKVIYKFADPDLEERSSGQKMMLRIGVDNARKVKAKLRQLRSRLTRR